jgi:glucose-1-phosphate thymidylyltransferase
MRVFILAGGFATRLWPLTEKRAKPLLPLAGKTLIDHLLGQLSWGLPVIISINAVFEKSFLSWKEEGHRMNVEILVEDTHKDTHKLGALGAVAHWVKLEHIEEDILLLTGDNYCGFSFKDVCDHYTQGTPLVAAHNIGDMNRAKLFGTIVPSPDSKHIQAFEEKPAHPKSTLVSTGCSVIPHEHLPILVAYAAGHPDNVGGIFEEFLRKGIPVEFRAYTEPWFDIGSFDSYLEATRALVGEHVIRGQNAECHETETRGSVVIGKGSRVRHSSLKDVILFEDCTVEDCVLENCILDDHCTLKSIDLTGKMLREGTVLTQK